jgi:hypothetical protein
MLMRAPRYLLQVEGLAMFAGAMALYIHADFSILVLVLLFLIPDLSLIGFAINPRVGAAAYNLVHTEVWPIALGVAGVLTGSDVPIQVALIWLAHIGVDRVLGYGFKYPTAFNDTHLQRL